ncbi:MAG: family 2 glycosyl transferase [Parcubacteria group bacterium Athens0714_16]|nr:MAG: family 2 glycosyl transferase [Parcubacteria group bacterium Athens0714_16]
MNKPLISVIIPTHNNSSTLREAINSIINQTYKNLEIIIINDNSSDNTFDIAREFEKKDSRIKIYYLPFDDPNRVNKKGRNINAGYMARNYGFEKCNGEWITFQDGDDISLPNRIEIQYKLTQKYDSNHVCINWKKEYREENKIDLDDKTKLINNASLYNLSQKTKGLMYKLFGKLNSHISFHIKTMRILNKLFFGSLEPYPLCGSVPMVKKEITDKIKFRQLNDRVWPSFTGRGADRDFNFAIAEKYKKSICFDTHLYIWRA